MVTFEDSGEAGASRKSPAETYQQQHGSRPRSPARYALGRQTQLHPRNGSRAQNSERDRGISTGIQSSGALMSMLLADGLAVIPEGVTLIARRQ